MPWLPSVGMGDDPDPGVGLGMTAGDLPARVGGTVVGDDQLPVRTRSAVTTLVIASSRNFSPL